MSESGMARCCCGRGALPVRLLPRAQARARTMLCVRKRVKNKAHSSSRVPEKREKKRARRRGTNDAALLVSITEILEKRILEEKSVRFSKSCRAYDICTQDSHLLDVSLGAARLGLLDRHRTKSMGATCCCLNCLLDLG